MFFIQQFQGMHSIPEEKQPCSHTEHFSSAESEPALVQQSRGVYHGEIRHVDVRPGHGTGVQKG